jgi:transposase
MKKITTIGLDLAKHVFQVHGVDASGVVVLQRRLRCGQVEAFFAELEPTLIGMEACATSHYWARQLRALGHEVRLMPAQYVKAYVKRQKNDAADAAAICEAVTRPTMRFVPIKSEEQQAALMLHRARDLLGPAAHDADQRVARSSGGVRYYRGAWHKQGRRSGSDNRRR